VAAPISSNPIALWWHDAYRRLIEAWGLAKKQQSSPSAAWVHRFALAAPLLGGALAALWMRTGGPFTNVIEAEIHSFEGVVIIFSAIAVCVIERLTIALWGWPVKPENAPRLGSLRQPGILGLWCFMLACVGFMLGINFLIALRLPDRTLIGRIAILTAWALMFFPSWVWLFHWRRLRRVKEDALNTLWPNREKKEKKSWLPWKKKLPSETTQ